MNLLENVKAVIFDFDGTFYDNHGVGKDLVLSHPLNLWRIKSEREVRKSLKNQSFGTKEAYMMEYSKRIASKTTLSVSKAQKWYEEKYLNWLTASIGKKQAYDKVEELITSLKNKGIKVAVYSDYPALKERMKIINLNADLADYIFDAESLGGQKPAKPLMEKILSEMGVTPDTLLVVGDRVDTDGESAFCIGARFVQIRGHKTKNAPQPEGYPLMDWDAFVKEIL